MKLNKTYFLITVLLFIIETLIAVFLKTGFIRHTVGDFLCVILLYCLVKSFIKTCAIKLAVAVIIFAFVIEFLQLFNILDMLHIQNNVVRIILGTTFQFSDLVAYTMGMFTFLVIDLKYISNEYYQTIRIKAF